MTASVLTCVAIVVALVATMWAARLPQREGMPLFIAVGGAALGACVIAAVIDALSTADLSWSAFSIALVVGVVGGTINAKQRLSTTA